MKNILLQLIPINWAYHPMGICPVQAEGEFMGYYFYFRARFDMITIEFAKTQSDWFRNKIVYSKILKRTNGVYDAGYYPRKECINLIHKGCVLFFIYKIFKIKL